MHHFLARVPDFHTEIIVIEQFADMHSFSCFLSAGKQSTSDSCAIALVRSVVLAQLNGFSPRLNASIFVSLCWGLHLGELAEGGSYR